jgi:hypothetical protein
MRFGRFIPRRGSFLMLTYLTNDVQTEAIGHDNRTLYEQYNAMQEECLVLRKRYQTLYERFHAFLERSPQVQEPDPDRIVYRQAMRDYSQSLQEQRRVIQHFRHSLHTHLINMRSNRSKQHSHIPADCLLVRKAILLAVGNEQAAALLKANVQQASAHRVFVAADWSEVMCLVQNVHIDVLVLGDELTPLPAMELYTCAHDLKDLPALPTIIMSDCLSPLHCAERAHSHLMELERPIKGDELVKAIEKLLI